MQYETLLEMTTDELIDRVSLIVRALKVCLAVETVVTNAEKGYLDG